jgi:hypothetical protein
MRKIRDNKMEKQVSKRQRSSRVFVSLIFLLLFGVAAQAQEYQRPKPKAGEGPPTAADLLSYEGAHNTIAVQIVNMTPYSIQLKDTSPATVPSPSSSSVTSADQSDMINRDRDTNKSFMFAPVGIPRFIPGTPRQLFDDLIEYDPNYQNTVTRPYSMLFSWDDQGGYVTDSWVKWTVKNVEYCTWWNDNTKTCTGDTGTQRGPYWATRDVDLGLWIYRNKPPDPPTSNLFVPMVKSTLKLAFESIKLLVEPENPIAWIKEFLAMKEVGDTYGEMMDFQEENKREDEGNKVYLASYVIPHPQSQCIALPENYFCTPSTISTGGDAVYSLWADEWAAPCPSGTNCPSVSAEGELVVTAHLLRGLTAPICPAEAPEYGGHTCGLGRVPIMMITVMRVRDFAKPVLTGGFSTGLTGTQSGAFSTGLTGTQSNWSLGPDDNPIRRFLLLAGGKSIQTLLEHRGRPGREVLYSVLRQLTSEQRKMLREMLRTMGSGRRPTQQERKLVRFIATALKKGLKG